MFSSYDILQQSNAFNYAQKGSILPAIIGLKA